MSLAQTFAIAAVAADLPVREVVLYKNGVGYFVRTGELKSGEAARLDFPAAAMNDVLKSMLLREKNGAPVTGIRYDSDYPLERKLSEFPFRIEPGKPLVALLDQLKGARVQVGTQTGILAGARILKGDEGSEREQITLLGDDGALRAFDPSAGPELKFLDPLIQNQLREYLSTLTASRSRDKKSIYIDSATDRARSIELSYLTPAPVWKSSYRLVLGADPMLEGWAIVDNASGEDWTNIRLALVSGRPVSFLSRLYEPRYVTRQYADLPESQPAAPQIEFAAVRDAEGGVGGGVLAGTIGRARAAAPPPAPKAMAAPSDLAVGAEGQTAGELFEYRFAQPVTVRRSESAMLPFLQQRIDARKLLIWRDSVNPRNAVELRNTSGKTLDGGPVTIFDGGAYAGEALLETLKGGEKRLISYAVDQGTRIDNRIDSGEESVTQVRATRGLLTLLRLQRNTTVYTIRNVDQRAKTLVVEHPLNPQSKVIGAQPVETTAVARRFEVPLKPDTTETFRVVEEQTLEESVAVVDLTPDDLGIYLRGKGLPEAGRKQLEAIAAVKRSLAEANRTAAEADKRIAALGTDQQRLRENIRSLSAVAGQQETVQRYVAQLTQLETEIGAQRSRQQAAQTEEQRLQGQLNQLLERLTF